MSGLQAALSPYKREVGPMPEKVSHAKKIGSFQMKKNELHSVVL